MAAVRNAVLGLLRQAGTGNIAAALRHYSYKPPGGSGPARNSCPLRTERPWGGAGRGAKAEFR